MHDTVLDVVSLLVALIGAATFAAMIWAARQVDGRPHAAPHLPHLHLPHLHRPHLHLPHPHVRRRP